MMLHIAWVSPNENVELPHCLDLSINANAPRPVLLQLVTVYCGSTMTIVEELIMESIFIAMRLC
jgi:hypothetical protein